MLRLKEMEAYLCGRFKKSKKISAVKKAALDKFLKENYLPGSGPEYLRSFKKKTA